MSGPGHGLRFTLRSVAVIGISLTMVPPAWANHEPARLGLTPVGTDSTYFEVRLEPGERRQLQVEAANFGDEEVRARTYGSDVYTLVNGGFGVDLFGEQPTGTTTWVSFPTAEYELGPDDAVVIDFAVEVPAGTAAGEYVTALVIENVEPVRGSGDVAVDQVNRSAIAVAIEVPGPTTPALAIGGVSHEHVAGVSVLSFGVGNPGNVHLRPAGEYVVRDSAGSEIAPRTAVAMDSVYAGTTTTLEVGLPEPLTAGEYCAELTLTDPETEATDSTACLPFTVATVQGAGLPDSAGELVEEVVGTVTSMPVLAGALVLGVAAVVLGFVVLVRRRRRPSAVDAPSPDGWRAAIGSETNHAEAAVGRVVSVMRTALAQHPSIARAWIAERDSAFVLAIEPTAGTTPNEAAAAATEIQERADREAALSMPLQVVSVHGAEPLARMTRDAVPFYVRLRDA